MNNFLYGNTKKINYEVDEEIEKNIIQDECERNFYLIN